MLQIETQLQNLNLPSAAREVAVITPPPGTSAYVYCDAYLPTFVAQSVLLATVPALKDYLTRMVVNPGVLAVYADVDPDADTDAESQSMNIKCLLDACEDATRPGANVHTATYTLKLSYEAQQLKKALDKAMDQNEFLEWLEENTGKIEDVATLLTAAAHFQSVTVTRFKSAKRLQNGAMQLIYDTEEQADEGLKMPMDLKFNIPVFMGEPSVTLPVLIRYRTTNGKLTFTLVCPLFKPLIRDTALAICEAFGTWVLGHEWTAVAKPLFVLGRARAVKQVNAASITEHKGGLLPTTVGTVE
jgi:hypothetical protein